MPAAPLIWTLPAGHAKYKIGMQYFDRTAGSFFEDRPLGWDPVAEGNRAGDGMARNNDDRRQWRKQGVFVGAAASKMQAVAKQMLGAATRFRVRGESYPMACRYRYIKGGTIMRVLIAAGGTAGHINPALAIAGAIKKADPSAEIHFAGRKEGMEYRLVTQAGYPFHHIEITGFQRKLSLHNIKRNIVTLWNLALSGPKAKAIMKEVKPDLVIGCGGYVSGPVVRCAAKQGIHTAIHEQNAFPGMTNKLLAPDVDIVFAAVPAAVEKLGAPEKTVVVGNPVRPEVFTKAKERDAIRAELGAGDRTVILSFGGSLGARRVNEVVADLCAWEQHEHKPVLHLHATGQYGVQLFKDLETEKNFAEGDSLVVKEYINNMPELLAAADLVISRAGALTLAELEAVGRAAVLIPSPNVAENHQYFNAMELQKAGAAVVIEEKDLTGEKLVATVSDMLAQPGKLAEMGRNARSLSVDDSLDRIADALMNLVGKH